MPRSIRIAAAGAVLAAAGLVLPACHDPADVVCQRFIPHTGDTLSYAAWDGPPPGQQYGGRYTCRARHADTAIFHSYCVYPPQHYPPPDDQWAWGACTF
jgi:hypothetical protein